MSAASSFLTAFQSIHGTGDFSCYGKSAFFFPQLEVKNQGEIGFPLSESQAKELVKQAEAAPYGKGSRTFLDEAVRRCWQIDAADVGFKSPEWQKFLGTILKDIAQKLGVPGSIKAEPYKLLIYGKGGHFRAHRDTEKLDAMFGTLILALPSPHEGGRLFIRHEGREELVDFSGKNHEFQYAAFFADCEHEVEPVQSGYRMCMVYNLCLKSGVPDQLNVPIREQAKNLIPALKNLALENEGQLRAILLEHSYTEANLSLHRLKGHDRSRALALLAACKEVGLVPHLALVTLHRSGALEDGYSYGRRGARRRGWDDDIYEDPENGTMGEIFEETLSIGCWRDISDRKVPLGDFPVDSESLLAANAIDAGEPDEKEAEGYTGNAGCTMDYWYRRAAIVLWGENDQEAILCLHAFPEACKTLLTLASGRATGPNSRFFRLGQAVIQMFSGESQSRIPHFSYLPVNDHPFQIVLAAFLKAKAKDLLTEFVSEIPAEYFVLCDSSLWQKLFHSFGVEAFEPVFRGLIAGGLEENRLAAFQLLEGLLAQKSGTIWAKTIVSSLVELRPLDPNKFWRHEREPSNPSLQQEEIRRILLASHLIDDPAVRKTAVGFLMADTSLNHIRKNLAPILPGKALAKHLSLPASLGPTILKLASGVLLAEVGRRLIPFPNWSRPCPESNSRFSRVIPSLIAFMADPDAESYRFTKSQTERSELETFINQNTLDLDMQTLTKGRPYTLLCTKNSNSYQRALGLRAKDGELLLMFAKLLETIGQ